MSTEKRNRHQKHDRGAEAFLAGLWITANLDRNRRSNENKGGERGREDQGDPPGSGPRDVAAQ